MFGKKGPTSSDKYALAPVEKDDGTLEIPPDPLRKNDDSLYTPELKAYFEARGADIHTQRVHFNPLRRAPAAVASAGR